VVTLKIYQNPETMNITKNLLYCGGFFFAVLYALFVMRPFRSAVAAQIGTSDLTYFLLLVVLVMLVTNGIYSLLVSRVKESKIVLFIYVFFISNLFLYAFFNYLSPDNYWVGATFYVWYNVFNFFVVSLFWARAVNCFDKEDAKKYFGVVSACGSVGAWTGSQSVYFFLSESPMIAMLLASVSLLVAIICSSRLTTQGENSQAVRGSSFVSEITEQVAQIKRNPLIQKMLLYALAWTCLATTIYFFGLEIVNAYTDDVVVKREIFALADSIVTPVSFFIQLFVAGFVLRNRWMGVRFVLVSYGVLFSIALLVISGYLSNVFLSGTGVLVFLIVSAVMRPFEYALNKPARESVYTTLKKEEKYKSTVFIDTFMNRFGDASGGLLFNGLILLGVSIAAAPMAILPLAGYLAFLGAKVSNSEKS